MRNDQIIQKVFAPFLLVMGTLAVYSNSLSNDFVTVWDDKWQVMNQYTEGRGWDGLKTILWLKIHINYRTFNHVNETKDLFNQCPRFRRRGRPRG